MTPTFVLDIVREAILVVLLVSAPMLGTALVVGLSISFVQAITSIQEASLVFVPKAMAMGLALVLLMPWYLRELVRFTEKVFNATSIVVP